MMTVILPTRREGNEEAFEMPIDKRTHNIFWIPSMKITFIENLQFCRCKLIFRLKVLGNDFASFKAFSILFKKVLGKKYVLVYDILI